MRQVVVLSEGLIEYRLDASGEIYPYGVSGDGVSIPVAMALLNKPLSHLLNREPVRIRMLSSAGDDADGNQIKRYCDKFDIDTSCFALVPGKRSAGWVYTPTRHRVKMVRKYINRNSENSPMDWLFQETRKEVTNILDSIDNDTVFVTSGIAASRPFTDKSFENMLHTIREARSRGATIVVDPSTRIPLFANESYPNGDPQFARARLLRLFNVSDIVLPSFPDDIMPQGIAVFTWETPESVKNGLFECGVSYVIVKLADSGSTLYRRDGSSWSVPALKVHDANPSGAGDSYVAGFALALNARTFN